MCLTAWIDRAKPRSIRCWTSPTTLELRGGLKLLEICPPVFKISFTIGLNGRYKSLRHGYLCFPEIVTGDEQASA